MDYKKTYSGGNREAEKTSTSNPAPRQVSIPELLDEIERAVLAHYGLLRENVFSRRRKKELVLARQTMHYLARHLTLMSLKYIGARFPAGEMGRDHSTVMHSVKVINNYLETDDFFNDTIEAIYAAIVRDGFIIPNPTRKLVKTKQGLSIGPKPKREYTMSEQEKVIAKYAPKADDLQPVGKMDVQITKYQ